MEEKQRVQESVMHSILALYGLDAAFSEQKKYINYANDQGDDCIRIILSVLLENGKRVIIKILREEDDLLKDRSKIERQSAFSEFMRQNGIKTPKRYKAEVCYCREYRCQDLPCNVTVEDWCGDEITEISAPLTFRIGELMARMHVLSLEGNCRIGCGTLFSAAYWNDVDAFQAFCKIGANDNLDQNIVSQRKKLHDEKLEALRAVWDRLPRAAVQGDISINNLVDGADGFAVFDYNNAGDEVRTSDLVMEGLLTAYEMDLPPGAEEGCREQFFPAFLKGYLSMRKLSEEEANAARIAYTLFHALWFTRVVYGDHSLEKLVRKRNFAAANRMLTQMLADMTEPDDGRFRN